jgi:hypothetical protein
MSSSDLTTTMVMALRSERTRARSEVGEVVRAWLSLLHASAGDAVALHVRVGEPCSSLPLTPVSHDQV